MKRARRSTALKLSLELIRREIPADAKAVRSNLTEADPSHRSDEGADPNAGPGLAAAGARCPGVESDARVVLPGFRETHPVAHRLHAARKSPSLPDAANMCLYRTLQEALANVVRHAGATRVEVRLRRDVDRVRLVVEDNGAGLGGGKTVVLRRNAAGSDCSGCRSGSTSSEAVSRSGKERPGASGCRPICLERKGMIRVVIADDHHLVREGIRALLEKAPDIEVVGEAGDGRETIDLVERLQAGRPVDGHLDAPPQRHSGATAAEGPEPPHQDRDSFDALRRNPGARSGAIRRQVLPTQGLGVGRVAVGDCALPTVAPRISARRFRLRSWPRARPRTQHQERAAPIACSRRGSTRCCASSAKGTTNNEISKLDAHQRQDRRAPSH